MERRLEGTDGRNRSRPVLDDASLSLPAVSEDESEGVEVERRTAERLLRSFRRQDEGRVYPEGPPQEHAWHLSAIRGVDGRIGEEEEEEVLFHRNISERSGFDDGESRRWKEVHNRALERRRKAVFAVVTFCVAPLLVAIGVIIVATGITVSRVTGVTPIDDDGISHALGDNHHVPAGSVVETNVPTASLKPTDLPSATPTSTPTTQAEGRFRHCLNLIWPFLEGAPTYTDRTVFDDIDTPQYRAMEWLARTYDICAVGTGDGAILQSRQSLSSTTTEQRRLLERYVAAVFYFATGGPSWMKQRNFLSSEHSVCDWHDEYQTGIVCDDDDDDGFISAISFVSESMSGSLPVELLLLAALTVLVIVENGDMSIRLSTYIGRLTNLVQFHVQGSAAKARTHIPTQIGQLTNLKRLVLGGQEITGTIPTEIGLLTSLERLWIQENAVFGTIPSHIGYLTHLEDLSIRVNDVGGTITSEIGLLSELQVLYFDFTNLHGTVPSQMADLKQLSYIYIDETDLVGDLDPIFCLSDQAPIDGFWATCAGSTTAGDLSLVTCSCCTYCCDSDHYCTSMTEYAPPSCSYGECVSCGNHRFASSCEECSDPEIPTIGSESAASARALPPEALCLGACMWNVEDRVCEDRTVFPEA